MKLIVYYFNKDKHGNETDNECMVIDPIELIGYKDLLDFARYKELDQHEDFEYWDIWLEDDNENKLELTYEVWEKIKIEVRQFNREHWLFFSNPYNY